MKQLDFFEMLGDIAEELAGSLRCTKEQTVPTGTERDTSRSETEVTRPLRMRLANGRVDRACSGATQRANEE